MAEIPELHLRQIERWCERHDPEHVREYLRVVARPVEDDAVTIVVQHPPMPGSEKKEWSEALVAQLRWTEKGLWALYWADETFSWQPYDPVDDAPFPAPLLQSIDEDHIFWDGHLLPD